MNPFPNRMVKLVGLLLIPALCWTAVGYIARKPLETAAVEADHAVRASMRDAPPVKLIWSRHI